jgi:glycyl-tRNA synthetase
MHPTTWKASGHVDNFSDPMIDNKDSKKRYRVDTLIEDKILEISNDIIAEIRKNHPKIDIAILESENSLPELFTNHREEFNAISNKISNHPASETIANAENELNRCLKENDFQGLRNLIISLGITCSVSKTANWTDVRQFNLMFETKLGSVTDEADTIYLRPETAQGIFVNFLNVQKTARMKIPFGIAQTGKAFRNEIVARQFIFRMREFEQMEMQFFIRPGTEGEWYKYWKKARLQWHLSLGIPEEKYRYHDHVKLAHYAKEACDIEYEFPMGFKEVEGIHSRSDFDLTQHQLYSKKKMQYFDAETDERTGKPYGNYIPYVIETSIGLDRMFLLILCNAYEEEILTKDDGSTDTRVVLHIPEKIAPNKLAILPLTKKDGLPELARDLMNECKPYFMCFYEEKDAIGKRYRRQDAIGTPFCATIDHQTKEDNTVTIRYRDSMKQERVLMSKVKDLVLEALM